MSLNTALDDLLSQLKQIRVSKNISAEEIEKKLILGPGWVEEFEQGKTVPRLDVVIALLNELGGSLKELNFSRAHEIEFTRNIQGISKGKDLHIAFPYGKYEANYILKDATVEQFDNILFVLRNGLAAAQGQDEEVQSQIKANAVSNAFMEAVKLWPYANASDLWWFIVYRAFIDPYNHPASEAKLNLDQSWKRTGGWALEKIVVKHYFEALAEKGIKVFIAEKEAKRALISQVISTNRVEADKADVLLTTETKGGEKLFGIINVKASFAERRTDDVPLSQSLIKAGYYSPLWTMDCKSNPSSKPYNKGELGAIKAASIDKRSAKRKDVEDDGFFSGCFSYNANTIATPSDQKAKANIYVCDFSNVYDEFFRRTVEARDRFIASLN
jgi:transcriptional regulator with XRE-family HTH domain